MTLSQEKQYELFDLLGALRDESITQDQFNQLQTWIKESPEVSVIYTEYCSLCSELRNQQAATSLNLSQQSTEELFREHITSQELLDNLEKSKRDKQNKQQLEKAAKEKLESYLKSQNKTQSTTKRPIDTETTRNPIKIYKLIATLAACLLIGIGLFIFNNPKNQKVAIITDMYAATTGELPKELVKGKTYHLTNNIVEIQFLDGASIILEGPSEIRMESANGAYLNHGKLVAQVPPQAIGFTINTKNASYVDHGTEFAIVAHKDGSSECYVSQGLVELKSIQNRFIQAGQAMGILPDGQTIVKKDFKQSQFFVRTLAPKQNLQWQNYTKAIEKTNPVGFWNFENENHLTQNMIEDSEFQIKWTPNPSFMGNSHDNLIENNDNTSLSLNSKNGYLTLIERDYFDAGFTLMMHLKLNTTEPQDIFIQQPSYSNTEFSRRLYLDQNGIMHISSFRGDDALTTYNPLECDVKQHSVKLNNLQWYHVALTISEDWLTIKMYINGQLYCQKTTTDEMPFESDFHNIHFGNPMKIGYGNPMKGAIDNLAIYDGVLKQSKIQQLYQATKE